VQAIRYQHLAVVVGVLIDYKVMRWQMLWTTAATDPNRVHLHMPQSALRTVPHPRAGPLTAVSKYYATDDKIKPTTRSETA
jgi:hypothetical protein